MYRFGKRTMCHPKGKKDIEAHRKKNLLAQRLFVPFHLSIKVDLLRLGKAKKHMKSKQVDLFTLLHQNATWSAN